MHALDLSGKRWSSLVIPAGFAIAVVLFAIVLIRWPDNFFADDSYFYFQVAWNAARGFGSTFNNILPTNGYHPLWMLVCIAVFKLLPLKTTALHGIAAAISILDVCALLLISLILKRTAPGFWWAAFLLYIPFSFLTQLGTEGALSGFFLAALALSAFELCSVPSSTKGGLFAFCASLAVLSRLDNIFIVSLICLGAFFASPIQVRPQVRRLLLLYTPLYLVLWGGYIGSNLYLFSTVQPISGMLKAHPYGETRHIAMPPHIALLGLTIIIPCILVLARFSNDTFFRVVELPFTFGVLIHACYIAFVLSSETRWSWYYTSWILLASILFSRVLALILASRSIALRNGLAITSLVVLFLVWLGMSERKLAHFNPATVAVGYQENMSDRLHLHTVLAFDKPGRMAYYTDVRVIALDGLMGDLNFQHDLATKGIAAIDAKDHVEGFVGPPQPLDAGGRTLFCDHVFLSAVQFHCVSSGEGQWIIDGVEVFARLTGASAGRLALPPQNLVWNFPHEVAVWRLP
jgi:hypothetical protein